MADPLAPIAANQQQHRRHNHNSNGSIKSFATAETHPDDSSNYTRDPVAPSSPFLYEAERSSRSPSKPSSPSKSRGKSRSPTKIALNDMEDRIPLTEETLRANEFGSYMETPRNTQVKNIATSSHRNYSPSESAFSAFSAIPNVDATVFAKLGLSPGKSANKNDERPASPTRSRPHTPPTTRPNRGRDHGILGSPIGEDGTTPLIDFTDQLNLAGKISRSPTRTRNSPSKDSRDQQYRTQRDAAGFKQATPGQIRELANLLDFDLPPAPTPRSLPSITPRELESLKAGLMSEISSLKATLQGKEAEISALKAASTDAENRVGNALEQLRETRNVKESLEQEKTEWERRDRETQRILKEVRTQIQTTDDERMRLEDRLADAERRAEDAELRVQEAESKAAGAAAGAQAVGDDLASEADVPGSPANKAVQIAVEKVARELHALYKAKHETKVSQLKKSYEARWSKRTDALKVDIDRLEKELQESRMEVDGLRHEVEESKLHGGRVDAMTTISPVKLSELQGKEDEIRRLQAELEQLKDQQPGGGGGEGVRNSADLPSSSSSAAAVSVQTKELEAKLSAMSGEVESLRSKTRRLARDLEISREENSALVATVDEFLSMDLDGATSVLIASTVPVPDSAPSSAHPSNASRPGSALSSALSASIHGYGHGGGSSTVSSSNNSHHHHPLHLRQPSHQDISSSSFSSSSSLATSAASVAATGPTGSSANSNSTSTSSNFGAAPTPKPSGLKGPGFGFGLGQSRIGLGPPPGGSMKRSVSGGAGSGSGSGIMSSIERMGRGAGGKSGE